MEELHELAAAHIQGSDELKEASKDLFEALDTDGDGQIDFKEFVTFMAEGAGFSRDLCKSLFNQLDKEKNGTLDYGNIGTLLYLVMSGRPACDACKNLIPGAYFTCVTCFLEPGDTFDVCLKCYRNRRWEHYHRDEVNLIDSFTMLRGLRESLLTAKEPEAQRNSRISDRSSSSNELISKDTMAQMKSAYNALETVVTVGTIASGLACTIM